MPLNSIPEPSQKKIRVRKACDSCNAKRTKCDGKSPCSHCSHIKIECTYLRQEKRRGRASAKYPKIIKKRKTALQNLIPFMDNVKNVIQPPKLNVQILPKTQLVNSLPSIEASNSCNGNSFSNNDPQSSIVLDFQLGETQYPILETCSDYLEQLSINYLLADVLLKFYFDSEIPPAFRVFSILRKIPMLQSQRPTKPILLLTILLSSATQINHVLIVGKKRDLLCQSLYKLIQSLLPSESTAYGLDDFISTIHLGFLMPWICYPSESVVWWRKSYDALRHLKINEIDPGLDGNVIEERLRAWWGLYILDRLTALCFNEPVLISDAECSNVYLPYDEYIWATTTQQVIVPTLDSNRNKFTDAASVGFDLYGWCVPICSIMGKFIQYKKATDEKVKKALKKDLIKSEVENLEALDKFQDMVQAISSPPKEAQATLDILYAKYLNHVLSFMTTNIDESQTLGEFSNEVTDLQLLKLAECIGILEEIVKLDENLHTYPFLLSFFLFVSGVSFISVLNNFNCDDHTNISKINRIKYFVKVLVRALEAIVPIFPCDFLKMVRSQLTLSIKDCENLILLTGYIEKFHENSKKRKELLKAYSWGGEGNGIAI